MKRGLCPLALAMLIIAIPFCTLGSETTLLVNGKSVELNHPLEEVADQTFAPINELGLYLGTEATLVEEEDSLVVRTSSGVILFPIDHFPILNGTYYAPLKQLASISSASIHRLGNEIYVESSPARMTGIDIMAEGASVRFDGFKPYQTLPSKPKTIHIRFHNCVLEATPQQVIPESQIIKAVALSVSGDYTADLVITLSHEYAIGIKHFIAEGYYALSFTFNQQQLIETEDQISPQITHHTLTTDIGNGQVKLDYLYIDQWRDRYHLLPAISQDGIGHLSSLQQLALSHKAQAAISANPYDTQTNIPLGLLVINNQALRLDYKKQAALGIDLFGRLSFLKPEVCLYLCTEDTSIAIDDLNRPIEPGELIMYQAGYAGPISRGVADSFRTLKIKSDRVTSVQEGPYIVIDPNASLLVACGTASERIASLGISDTVSLELIVNQGENLITNAVGDGELLYLEGNKILNTTQESPDAESYMSDKLASRTVLATDWYGGLILMSIVRNSNSVGIDLAGIHYILEMLPVKLKNAIAFDGKDSGAMVFSYHSTYREILPSAKVAVGLLLVPMDQ